MFGDVDDEDIPAETEQRLEVWHRFPDCWRIERDPANEFESSLKIHVGSKWWDYSQSRGALSNAEDDEVTSDVDHELGALFEPWPASGGLSFEPSGTETVAGRRALTAIARPRPPTAGSERSWMFETFLYGADQFRLAVDAERGVLLRIEALSKGQMFKASELLEVTFDEPLADSVFEFTAPDDGPVRSPLELGRYEHGLLHELAAKATFQAFSPAKLAPEWELHATLGLSGEPGQEPTQLHLMYHSRDAAYGFQISESPASDPASGYDPHDQGWKTVERDGLTFDVLELEDSGDGLVVVRCEREGTRIEIQSQQLALERLIEVAAELRPAPTEAPPPIAGDQ